MILKSGAPVESLIMKNFVCKNKSMYMKVITALIIIVLLIIFAPNNKTPIYNSGHPSGINNPISFVKSGVNDYTNLSTPFTVNSYASGQNNSQLLEMYYISSTGTLLNASAQMMLPDDWSGYYLYVYVYEVSENRSWVLNPGFQGSLTNWVPVINDQPSSTNNISVTFVADGHGVGDDAVEFAINGSYDGVSSYRYDSHDGGYIEQTFTVPRGEVVWAGLKLDYKAWTLNNWGMTGAFRIYVTIEGSNVWRKSFDDIILNDTWLSTDLISLSTAIFNLPADQAVTMQVLSLIHI